MQPESNRNHIKDQTRSQKAQDQEMRKKHGEELGLDVPEDYFHRSKKELLQKLETPKKGKLVLLTRNKSIWLAAASFALILALSFFRSDVHSAIDEIPVVVSDTIKKLKDNDLVNEILDTEEKDVLISSLFIEDTELDEFINDYVINEALEEDILIE